MNLNDWRASPHGWRRKRCWGCSRSYCLRGYPIGFPSSALDLGRVKSPTRYDGVGFRSHSPDVWPPRARFASRESVVESPQKTRKHCASCTRVSEIEQVSEGIGGRALR
jgi:hypothetical protein